MYEIAQDQTGPRVVQLSIFLPNRPGALVRVVRNLEEHTIRICGLSILDSADHAVIRMTVDRPDMAIETLSEEGFTVHALKLLAVELPEDRNFGTRQVLSTLLLAEVNISYLYTLIVQPNNRPIIVLHVDDAKTAVQVLQNHNLQLMGQDEISTF
jgi:hypothetical protein